MREMTGEMRVAKPKVFGIGMFKTGLTSLGEALRLLGYRYSAEEWYHGKIIDDPWDLHSGISDDHLQILIARAREYDALIDFPWMFRFREMDAAFADARFSYTVRDPERVARSHRNHRKQRGTREEDLPSGERIIGRYREHGELVRRHFAGRKNFLIMDVEAGAGWATLCGFLGEPVPGIAFPWANRGIYQ